MSLRHRRGASGLTDLAAGTPCSVTLKLRVLSKSDGWPKSSRAHASLAIVHEREQSPSPEQWIRNSSASAASSNAHGFATEGAPRAAQGTEAHTSTSMRAARRPATRPISGRSLERDATATMIHEDTRCILLAFISSAASCPTDACFRTYYMGRRARAHGYEEVTKTLETTGGVYLWGAHPAVCLFPRTS